MKILSFGDLHIGTVCDPDVEAAAKEICSKAAVICPDLIVITGDIYEGTSDPEIRQTAARIVISMANIARVAIIKGNHDIRKDLLILGKLAAKNKIMVFESPDWIQYLAEDLFVHFMPWITKASWIAGRFGADLGIEAGNQAVSLLALQYLKIQVSKGKGGKHILFSHLMVSGSKAENHQPLLGEGVTFGYHDLVEAGFSAGAFGHIHLAQSFGSQGYPVFRYNGSIAALNYGESARNKGFSVLDTDTMQFEVYELSSIARITLDAIWDGHLTWDSDLSILEKGARVRVRMLVYEGYSAADGEKSITEYFNNPEILPIELKIERQTKPKDQVRATEIASAQKACQKLEAYWAATATTPDEPMRTDMLQITSEIEMECSINK